MLEDLLTQYFKPLKDYLPNEEKLKSLDPIQFPLWQYREKFLWSQRFFENLKLNQLNSEDQKLLFFAKLILEIGDNFKKIEVKTAFSDLNEEDQKKLFQFVREETSETQEATHNQWATSLLITLCLRDNNNAIRAIAYQLFSAGTYDTKKLSGIEKFSSFAKYGTIILRSHEHLQQTTYIELSCGNFSGQHLSRLNFSGLNLHDANFKGATLTELHLTVACLENANFVKAILNNTKCEGTSFICADLSEAKCNNMTVFNWANFYNAKWIGAAVSEADLTGALINFDDKEKLIHLENNIRKNSSEILSNQKEILKKWINDFKQKLMSHSNTSLLNLYSTELSPELNQEQNSQVKKYLVVSQPPKKNKNENDQINLSYVISLMVHNTSDCMTYAAPRFEGSRLKKAWYEGKFWPHIREELRQTPIHHGYPESITIKKITYLENPTLWKRYAKEREAIKNRLYQNGNPMAIKWHAELYGLPILNSKINESWLFHGTKQEVQEPIAAGGFDPERGDGPNGKGQYFSDLFSKAATYCDCPNCKKNPCKCNGEKPLKVIFLCRVILGNIYVETQKKRRGKFTPDSYDSCYAPSHLYDKESKTRCNEFVVSNVNQIYPEFCIHYQENDLEALDLEEKHPDTQLLSPRDFRQVLREKETDRSAQFKPAIDNLFRYYNQYYIFLKNNGNTWLRRAGYLEQMIQALEALCNQAQQSLILLSGLHDLQGRIALEKKKIEEGFLPISECNRYFKIQMDHFFYVVEPNPNQWSHLISQYVEKQKDRLFEDSTSLLISLAVAYYHSDDAKSLECFSDAYMTNKEEALEAFSLPRFSKLEFIKKIMNFIKEKKVTFEGENIKGFIIQYLSSNIIDYVIGNEITTDECESYYWGLPSWDERKNFYEVFKTKLTKLKLEEPTSQQRAQLQTWMDELPCDHTGSREGARKRQQKWFDTIISLTDEVSNQPGKVLLKYFDNQGQLHQRYLKSHHVDILFNKDGTLQFSNGEVNGRCYVTRLGDENNAFYIKFYPQFPFRQYAADHLFYRLSGYGAQTVFAKLEYMRSHAYPVLLSQALGETLFSHRVDREKRKIFPELDQKAFSWRLLETFVLPPEDETDNNNALSPIEGTTNFRPISFDYDTYMPKKVVEAGRSKVNTILYFFPNMKRPLHPLVIQAFLSLDYESMLKAWWKELLEHKNNIIGEADHCLFKSNEAEIYRNQNYLPVKIKNHKREYNLFCEIEKIFRLGDMGLLYSRMLHLHELLVSQNTWSGKELFEYFEPELDDLYNKAKTKMKEDKNISTQTQLEKIYRCFASLPNNLNVVEVRIEQEQKEMTCESSQSSQRKRNNPIKRLFLGDQIHSEEFLTIVELEEKKCISNLIEEHEKFSSISTQVNEGDFISFSSAHISIQQMVVNNFRWYVPPMLVREKFLNRIVTEKIGFSTLVITGCDKLENQHIAAIANNSPTLTYVDIHKCSKINEDVFFSFSKHCKYLQVLHAEYLSRVVRIEDRHVSNLGFQRLKALYLQGSTESSKDNNLQSISLSQCLPELEILRIDDQQKLQFFKVHAPKLQILKANGCATLSDLQTGSQLLGNLDIRGCDLLSEAKLSQIAQEVIHLNQVQLPSHLRHVSFRMQFPYLFDLPIATMDEHKIEEIFKDLRRVYLLSNVTSLVEFRRAVRQGMINLVAFYSILTHDRSMLLLKLNSEDELEIISTLYRLATTTVFLDHSIRITIIPILLKKLTHNSKEVASAAIMALDRILEITVVDGISERIIIDCFIPLLEVNFKNEISITTSRFQGSQELITSKTVELIISHYLKELNAGRDEEKIEFACSALTVIGEIVGAVAREKIILNLLKLDFHSRKIHSAITRSLGRLALRCQNSTIRVEVISKILRADLVSWWDERYMQQLVLLACTADSVTLLKYIIPLFQHEIKKAEITYKSVYIYDILCCIGDANFFFLGGQTAWSIFLKPRDATEVSALHELLIPFFIEGTSAPDWLIRAVSCQSLGVLGRTTNHAFSLMIREKVISLISDSEWMVRINAYIALEVLDSPRPIFPLSIFKFFSSKRMLNNTFSVLQLNLNFSAENGGDISILRQTIPKIVEKLSDSKCFVSDSACAALAIVGNIADPTTIAQVIIPKILTFYQDSLYNWLRRMKYGSLLLVPSYRFLGNKELAMSTVAQLLRIADQPIVQNQIVPFLLNDLNASKKITRARTTLLLGNYLLTSCYFQNIFFGAGGQLEKKLGNENPHDVVPPHPITTLEFSSLNDDVYGSFALELPSSQAESMHLYERSPTTQNKEKQKFCLNTVESASESSSKQQYSGKLFITPPPTQEEIQENYNKFSQIKK